MQLNELREALKICLPYSFAKLAEKLGLSEPSLYRKLNGQIKFKARELLVIKEIVLPTAPLTTFLDAYGFEPGTYEPLALNLDTYADLEENLMRAHKNTNGREGGSGPIRKIRKENNL